MSNQDDNLFLFVVRRHPGDIGTLSAIWGDVVLRSWIFDRQDPLKLYLAYHQLLQETWRHLERFVRDDPPPTTWTAAIEAVEQILPSNLREGLGQMVDKLRGKIAKHDADLFRLEPRSWWVIVDGERAGAIEPDRNEGWAAWGWGEDGFIGTFATEDEARVAVVERWRAD